MPKVKSERRSDAAAAAAMPYESPVKNGHDGPAEEQQNGGGGTAGEEAVGTVATAGFRDGERARQTLQGLRERDSAYQFQVVNSLQRRARTILKRTKDQEKLTNLGEAIKVFEDWLNEYKAHNRSRENFSYLPLDTMQAYVPLAEHYGIKAETSEKSFLKVYQAIGGDSRQLRTTKVPGTKGESETVTWDIERNRHLRELSERMRTEYLPLFEFDAPLRGLPTREHCQLIMWGYSPEPTKVKKLIPQLAEKLKVEN